MKPSPSGQLRTRAGWSGAEPKVTARFPATANQRMYWRQEMAMPGKAHLNVSFRYRLAGQISDEAIAQALQALVDRHEILRTRLSEGADGGLVQEVLEPVGFKPDQVDLRRLPKETRQAELEQLGQAEACKPFDMGGATGPASLFRALVVRGAADEAYLHLTFHHLVMDGWSLDLLVREFGENAAAVDARRSLERAPVPMHFGDFARWQQDQLDGGAFAVDRKYWQARLAGLPDFTVRPDRPGTASGKPSEIRSILLPRDLSDAFEQFAKANGHTLFTLATTAAALSLGEFTGQPEVVLGTQVAGRNDPDSEGIIGPLINTVVLRLPLDRKSSFIEQAERVRDETRAAIAHQLLPYAETVGAVRPDLTGGEQLHRVNFVVQRAYIASGSMEDCDYGHFRIESVASQPIAAQYDINLFMVGREEGWRLSCEFAPALYDRETVDRLLDAWRGAIESAVRQHADAGTAAGVATTLNEPGALAPPAANPRLAALKARILALQSKGTGTPIMAINNASVLYPVARAIGEDHPFYDIQFCPSDTPTALPRRHFADHARDAVEMIRLARPHGPYILFGLCVCGAIAIEAARILQSEGETVELVVLNDTYRPGYRERMGFFDRHVRAWQVRYLSTVDLWRRVRAGELTFAQFLDNYRILRALGISRFAARMAAGEMSPQVDAMAEGNRWFAEGVLMPSQADFEMTPYTGQVLMFRCEAAPNGRLFPRDFGWEGFVDGKLTVIDCPGTHDTMFRAEGAAVIGPAVRRMLEPGE